MAPALEEAGLVHQPEDAGEIGTRSWTDHEVSDLTESGSTEVIERKRTPLPKLQLVVLLYIQMAEPITGHVMLPFIVQLVKETGISGGDIKRVGYYTGLADSFFFFAEALTILQWGRLSDNIGRRPVLFIGLFGLALSTISFGMSHTFWTMVASRAIAGFLTGNKAVIKSTLGEITDETNVAQAFAVLPLVWATGNTISPLIGGMLQHPYERLGGVFRSEFWRTRPYFLPCAVTALFSTSAFFLGFFLLTETAPCGTRRTLWRQGTQYIRLEEDVDFPDTPTPKSKPSPPPLRTLLTRRILIVILNYSLLGIIEVAFYVLQPLVLSTPIAFGGLGMPPSLIGKCISAFAFFRGIVSALLFAPLTRKYGTRRLATACVSTVIGCYALFPLMNALARIEGRITPVVWVAFIFQLSLAAFTPMGYSCIFIYLTAAAPTSSALGATNGLAQTTTAVMRSLGPAGVASLFAFSTQYNVMGGCLVYVVMCFVAAAATTATLLLPVKPWDRPFDYDMEHLQ